MKRDKRSAGNPYGIPKHEEISVKSFGTGEAAEILDIPIWRLRNFLDGPAYQISPHDQIGKGKGSRRIFSREGLYRLAVATVLARDGFTPKFVGGVLSQLSEHDFYQEPHIDEHGDDHLPDEHWGIQLRRTPQGPKAELFSKMSGLKLGGPIYYALDLQAVKQWVDGRIQRQRVGESKGNAKAEINEER